MVEGVLTIADNTRYWLTLVHEHRLRSEGAIDHAIRKLQGDSGWSQDAMPIMFLRADIGAYRRMADELEAKLKVLTKQDMGKAS